ncbi:AlbA family DNA-binding domain-containing protein [Rhodococcus erythropolis]|uniref:AlbA family DNA-binding domain-containing protein n=1 Tax=Rhodococcus erythropolis TaxID=1833 RepID=UPI000878994E|nr:ATP-binding protein [Rhodococcus erythropolis]OFV73509.1 hypothetical protein RERY_58350 [Rhodococcus erythropolis]
MTYSFHLRPQKPRFTPSGWDDIANAAADGILDDPHWVELKRTLPPRSAGVNTELARDLASLSVDGGVFVIGIEDNHGKPGAVTGADTRGFISRLDATTKSIVTPPLTISTTTIPHPTDPELAVLVVTVPASADAPHMVDNKYWGRGDEGKRPLSDIEVRRLLAFRQERADGFETRLRFVGKAIGVEPRQQRGSYLQILVEPASPPHGTNVTEALDKMLPLEFFTAALQTRLQWSPSLHSLSHRMPHPDGFAAKSFGNEDLDLDNAVKLLVLVADDGSWRAVSGAPVQPLDASGDFSSARPVFRAIPLLELTHSIFASVAYLSTHHVPLNTQWQVGIQLSRLRGVYPVERHNPRHFGDFSAFPRDEYLRTATTTTDEMSQDPASVVDRLTRPLLRSMSIDRHYLPYEEITEIGNRKGR